MRRMFHFMRRIRQCGKVDRISRKQHPPASGIRHRSITYAHFIAAFLRNKIFRQVIRYFVLVNAKFCTFPAVCIRLCRTKPIPFYMIVIRVECKEHAKLRHISQFFYRIVCKRCLHGSISVNGIRDFTGTMRRRRHMVHPANRYRIVSFAYF